jgi:RNA polymerase sigma-70 factor (ECF subfamily)
MRRFSMPDRSSEFAELYVRHALDVYRFALGLSGDSNDAEDITAEAFARAFTAATPIRTATVGAYLLTIARHYYLETRRRRGRDVPISDAIRDSRPEPHARAEASTELEAVSAALDRLPEADRSAILMRAVHVMPYEDIARSLGISIAAAKVKVHRARLMLAGLIPRHR